MLELDGFFALVEDVARSRVLHNQLDFFQVSHVALVLAFALLSALHSLLLAFFLLAAFLDLRLKSQSRLLEQLRLLSVASRTLDPHERESFLGVQVCMGLLLYFGVSHDRDTAQWLGNWNPPARGRLCPFESEQLSVLFTVSGFQTSP